MRENIRILLACGGFLYDLVRFSRFSAWRTRLGSKEARNYYVVKLYHTLEKSMSFSNRRSGAGWANADLLVFALEKAIVFGNVGFHDYVAVGVLKKFADVESGNNKERSSALRAKIKTLESALDSSKIFQGGVAELSSEDLRTGMLASPEDFFLSRYSVREFDEKTVDESLIKRAIHLAMKSPSVCNRQAWHVYYVSGDLAKKSLSFQDGNRGFGHNLKEILVITVDLRAFVSHRERYQHWIDGGMFSMSLVWALHSLGVASCCLNWSQSVKTDLLFRKAVGIEKEHTMMMMLAIGYPRDTNLVCSSLRRPIEEIYTKL